MSLREMVFLALANNLPRLPVSDRVRPLMYKLAGMRLGRHVVIWGPLTIRPIGGCNRVQIGDGAFLNTEIRFGCPDATVTIGNRAQIGPRVSFETVNHGLRYEPGKGRGATSLPIVIEDNVWIGAGAIILQGVTIGRGSVISAGAVVNRDVPPGVLAGGCPAKVIKPIE